MHVRACLVFVPHPDTLFTGVSKQGKPTGTKKGAVKLIMRNNKHTTLHSVSRNLLV